MRSLGVRFGMPIIYPEDGSEVEYQGVRVISAILDVERFAQKYRIADNAVKKGWFCNNR